MRNAQSQPIRIVFGASNDIPVPGDYRGLGRLELGVFRPNTGEWFVRSDDGHASRIQFGLNGDLPVSPNPAVMMNVLLR